MSAALQAPMTLDEFLEWESHQEGFHEFDGFNIVAMNGGTAAHWTIQGNLITLLTNGLRGRQCRAFSAGMKVRTRVGIRYPDALVVCSPVKANAQFIDDPVIVFEITSPSSVTLDHTDKNQEYRDLPSIQRYVILEQSRKAATVFARQGDDWVGHLHINDAVIDLPDIGVTLTLAELYEGAFDPPE
jgi:Uma2 family endonuclease